jgi:tRNA(fMet)-specific endonuclease VapC
VTAYLLDTNIASDAIKGTPAQVRERLVALPVHEVGISAVTQGELMYGLEKRGNPAALTALVRELLIRVTVLPWTSDVANVYGSLRASCSRRGVNLGALDMMIAAQALTTGIVLVTRDQAFGHVKHGLRTEDWAH